MDINIYDDYSDSKDDQETMLSDALLCYGYKEDEGRKECPYIVDIVRFFLEHGYDPHANEEYNGIHALFALAYSTQCDKYSIEAIKLLLQAGANTEKNVYEDEDYTSIHWIVINHDGDNRGICDYDYYAANYFYTFEVIISYKEAGKDYFKVYHPGFVIGKQLSGIFIMDGFESCAGYTGNIRDTYFGKLYFDCEGYMLNISERISLIVDPYLEGDAEEIFTDVSGEYQEYIGHKIMRIDYEYSRIENYFRPIIHCIIIFDNGLKLIISEDYLEGPRPNKFFMYLEKG